MALEDGATIAEMLGLWTARRDARGQQDDELNRSQPSDDINDLDTKAKDISRILKVYQRMRKERTELNVRGAESNRIFLHMPAGPELEQRDQTLREWDWENLDAKNEWPYFDPTYARELMSFDAEKEARVAFEQEFRRREA